MGATSRPDMVDPALLRPGRLDKSVYCGFPEKEERAHILEKYLARLKFEEGVDVEKFAAEMAEQTEGFTSADLKGVV